MKRHLLEDIWNRLTQSMRQARGGAPLAVCRCIARCVVLMGVLGSMSAAGSTAQVVSPPLPVAPPLENRAQTQTTVAVAAGNGIYLVAWVERTYDNPSDPYTLNEMPDILAMRVRASDGARLDAQPLRITRTPNVLDFMPAIAFDGENFLVVFCSLPGGPPLVYGARVRASDGAVLDTPRLISKTPMGGHLLPEMNPSVAFDGVNYLVVWEGNFHENGTVSYGVQGIRVRPSDGQTIESSSILIARDISTGGSARPQVAYGAGRYLVVWNEGRISGARIAPATGHVLDAAQPIRFSPAVSGAVPGVASAGEQFLVVWNGAGGQLLGNRVRGSDRAVLDGTGFIVDTENLGAPSVAFDGQDYRVAWPGSREGAQMLLSTRVTTGGQADVEFPLSEIAVDPYRNPRTLFPISAMEPGRFLVPYETYYPQVYSYGRAFFRLVQDVRDEPCTAGVPTLAVKGGTALTLECGPGPYTDLGAQAWDGCGNGLPVHSYNSGQDPHGPGPNMSAEGSYSVQYIAWDAMGQTVSALRTVQVDDRRAPTLRLNGAAQMTHTCGSQWVDPGVEALDACYGNVAPSVRTTGSVNGWAAGTYTVRYDVTDSAGNSATPVTRTVQVVNCPW